MMGRPPKPNRLRLIQGKPGHRPLREQPQVALTDIFDEPPAYRELPEPGRTKAQDLWRRLVPDMLSGFYLADTDYPILEAFYATYALWHNALASGDQQAERRARADLLAYSAKLGLNPADRLRLQIPPREPETSSVLD